MRLTFRAPAVAVAAFSLFAFTSFAAPTSASEAPAPTTVPYTAHGAAMIPAVDLGLDSIDQAEGQQAEPATNVAVHAMAPALPAVDEPAEIRAEQRAGRSLSQLVADLSASETADEESECLARAVYYESKGEPLAGQLSVAEVIINRAESGRFASTLCGVIRQRGQFSFVRGGQIPTPPRNAQWRTAVAIARIATGDLAEGAAPRALFFHARHVNPRWRHTRVATVGNHIFYR